jgi:polyisoprenoid-binding protein YceI
MKHHFSSPTFSALACAFICLVVTAVTAGAVDDGPAADTGAPAGQYQLDPTHTSLSFSVNHLGLSNYAVRFTNYTATLQFDPAQPGKSSITASIDPGSLRTYYPADYRASHPDSKFASWDEDLSQSEKFFNAGKFPQISFRSTAVQASGPDALHIVGELTLLGQTHPVELNAIIVGSTASHPMKPGLGAIGFSARGSLRRSEFGMNYLLDPPLVGDVVTIAFEGEFHQVGNQ